MPVPNTAPRQQGSLDNPLEPIAWMFFQVRMALEDAPDGRSPRWVRIARGRAFKEEKPVGPLVSGAVEIFLEFLSATHHLLLTLDELLLHVDPEKAVVELLLEMAKAATAPELGSALSTLTGKPEIAARFAEAQNTLKAPDRFLKFIPEPVDVLRIGREIYELLHVGFQEGKPVVDLNRTGRARLLAWAFGLPIKVRVGPKTGASANIPVKVLGLRDLPLGKAAAQKVAATWPPTDAKGKEMFAFDLTAGEDLAEIVSLLDGLGYREPAVTPGPMLSGPLSARLTVFQRLNDLPDEGRLDTDTLHRLLNLDAASRNIARARPFDEARFKAIPPAPPPKRDVVVKYVIVGVPVYETRPEDPPRSGELRLVNPAADRPEDEGITFGKHPGTRKGEGQKEPRKYYICGAEVPAGAEVASFPTGVKQGWIRHRDDDDRLFLGDEEQKTKLGCCFVGMESRPGTKGGYEGGMWSEGGAFSNQSFFFSAREVEPWMSGRNGQPAADALFKGAWAVGNISGMYQWAAIDDLVRDTLEGERLYVQAVCARRSLYKERGAGRLPDQGRIVMGLSAPGAAFPANPLAARFKRDLLSTWAWSGLWPSALQADLQAKGSNNVQGGDWVLIGTPELEVGAGVTTLFVALYGRHGANHDTDAYFDEVRVLWRRDPAPPPPSTPAP